MNLYELTVIRENEERVVAKQTLILEYIGWLMAEERVLEFRIERLNEAHTLEDILSPKVYDKLKGIE